MSKHNYYQDSRKEVNNMQELLLKIEEACSAYHSEELDDESFQNVINEIPEEVWSNKESALSIIQALVENKDLFELTEEQQENYAEFICNLLPQTVRENPDCILGTAEIIAKFMNAYCEGVSASDLDIVFSCMPQTPWDNVAFLREAIDVISNHAYSMYDLNSVSEIIPTSAWKNENDLIWLIRSLYTADDRNMNDLYILPQKSWEYPTVIYEILSCLQTAIENDREWGSMYSNFRGSNNDFLESFLDNVPEKFKSDKQFILGLLEFDYFSEAFQVIYDWIDSKLWSDKDFVMEVLEIDRNALINVPEELSTDETLREYIDENINLN